MLRNKYLWAHQMSFFTLHVDIFNIAYFIFCTKLLFQSFLLTGKPPINSCVGHYRGPFHFGGLSDQSAFTQYFRANVHIRKLLEVLRGQRVFPPAVVSCSSSTAE